MIMSLVPRASFSLLSRRSSNDTKPRRRRSSASATESATSAAPSAAPSVAPSAPESILPTPYPVDTLTYPAPSLGSNTILPRPKRGAPPVDLEQIRVAMHAPLENKAGLGFAERVKRALVKKPKKRIPVHPGVCADWY